MPSRVLVVANQTAASHELLEAVRSRAAAGDATFTLLVPAGAHGLHRVVDPEDAGRDEATVRLAEVLPAVQAAAGQTVHGRIGDANPYLAVCDELHVHGHDEVLLSTLPGRVSRWLKMDLPSRVRALGVPVTHVEAADREAAAV